MTTTKLSQRARFPIARINPLKTMIIGQKKEADHQTATRKIQASLLIQGESQKVTTKTKTRQTIPTPSIDYGIESLDDAHPQNMLCTTSLNSSNID